MSVYIHIQLLGLVSDNPAWALLSRISSHVLHLIHSVSTRLLPDGWLTCIPSEFLLLRIQTRTSQGLGILSLHLFYVLASQEDFLSFTFYNWALWRLRGGYQLCFSKYSCHVLILDPNHYSFYKGTKMLTSLEWPLALNFLHSFFHLC